MYYRNALSLFKESLKYSSNNAKYYEIEQVMRNIERKLKNY